MPPVFQTASHWTDSFLDPMRQVGDPLADAVIENLFSTHSIDSVNALMRNLVLNEYPEPSTFPPDRCRLRQAARSASGLGRFLQNRIGATGFLEVWSAPDS